MIEFKPVWLKCMDLNISFFVTNTDALSSWIQECLARGGHDFHFEVAA